MTGDSPTLAFDPGRNKVGWALAREGGRLVASGIVAVGELDLFLDAFFGGELLADRWLREELVPRPWQIGPGRVILGTGTGSDLLARRLLLRHISFEEVDESFSTLRARELYWRLHPPRGLLRLLPSGLRLPPRDVDDLAAWSLLLSDGTSRE
ncbi:endonuclease [Aminithiophilus ramosus]|uniref:Endonuclease n=2 Tax=Synergistales TaxID=649776 RepID=A0A9Q7A994_9BACT|nr:endonuclease [Aminithiophilus ramosus]QTX32776.1 endonuclease [Aminithiophilus ramosus]QVL36651.1 endonuclease [Synergistota bacterium]